MRSPVACAPEGWRLGRAGSEPRPRRTFEGRIANGTGKRERAGTRATGAAFGERTPALGSRLACGGFPGHVHVHGGRGPKIKDRRAAAEMTARR